MIKLCNTKTYDFQNPAYFIRRSQFCRKSKERLKKVFVYLLITYRTWKDRQLDTWIVGQVRVASVRSVNSYRAFKAKISSQIFFHKIGLDDFGFVGSKISSQI